MRSDSQRRGGRVGRWLQAALVALATGAALLPAVPAAAKSPQLIPGKKTLYERVLTRPGALLVAKAGDGTGRVQSPFTSFYVYDRVTVGADEWIQVGAGTAGATDGFLRASQAVAWNTPIALSFATRSNRNRALFFRDDQQLQSLLEGPDRATSLSTLQKEAIAGKPLGAAHPVIAVEPQTEVDIQKSFYLLPVLRARQVELKGTSQQALTLARVASINLDAKAQPTQAPAATPGSAAPGSAPISNVGLANFSSAVVFVTDATSSMQPYIDRTRAAIGKVLSQVEADGMKDRVRFGLVAFQDDPASAKGMEYLSKVFADPNKVTTLAGFQQSVASLRATPSSTRAFAEDAYAGLDAALRQIDWRSFGGRYVVLVTDASAREGGTALASSALQTDELNLFARENRIAIFTLHLKTAAGRADHQRAAQQYRKLSAWPGSAPLYYPVEAGNEVAFEEGVLGLANSLVGMVKAPQKVLAALAGDKTSAPASPTPAAPAPATPAPSIAQAVQDVGQAMVLGWLGSEAGQQAPAFYEAWTSDQDLSNPTRKAMTIRVLLTKEQLSDLHETLRRVIDAGDKALGSPDTFYDHLRSVAAAMSRDPSQIGKGKARTLQEAGLMGEYLEGLPYRSELASLSIEEFIDAGPLRQQQIIDRLKSKLALYPRFHADADAWVKLNPKAADGDKVYPVPIDALP